MLKNKKIGVVIRAYNEQKFISEVVQHTPEYVDIIYVINDASTDDTLNIITDLSKGNGRIVLVNHKIRRGSGAAAISGYKKAIDNFCDYAVLMDGDGQMDSNLLIHFLDPLISGKADYVKGNRLCSRADKQQMPAFRLFGNYLLTFLTRIASGYWHISDPQNGYTAISLDMLKELDLDKIDNGFAYENDMLVKLNVIGARVLDIQHPAVYRGQQSKIRYGRFILITSWVLVRDFIWRIWIKYIRCNSRSDKVMHVIDAQRK